MDKFNRGFDMDVYIQTLDPGLDRAVLRALQYHVGQGASIRRRDLVNSVKHYIPDVRDRAIRLTINRLRKDGFPICSTGGVDGGYWIAANPAELDEYITRELKSRALDLHEQIEALNSTRRAMWGDGVQVRLF